MVGRAPWWRLPSDFPGQQNPGHGQARAGSPECPKAYAGGFLQPKENVWNTPSKAEMGEGLGGGADWAPFLDTVSGLGFVHWEARGDKICFFLFCFNGISQASFSYLSACIRP